MRAKDLFEKSTSQAQFRTMAAAANNPKFAKKVGISQDVAREFHAADRKSDYKKLPDHANESQLNELFDADQQYFKLADGQVIRADFTQAGLNPDGMSSSIKISTVDPKIMPSAATTAVQPWDKARPNIRAAIQKWVQGGQQTVSEIKKGQKDSNGYTKCWPGKHAEGTKKSAVTGKQVRNCVPNEGVEEAANPAQQAAIAIAMKKAGQKPKSQGVAEGLPGEFIGGTAGGVGGAVVGAAVGGPMGALVGGAAGGTAGQIAGRELTDEQKLNEIAPLLAAGARLFMAAAPKIAQVAGKVGQAGARGVGQAAKAGAGIAAKNAGQIGIGAGAYEIGSSVADIVKDITTKVGAAVDEKTIFDLATLAFKYAIPAGIVLAILYGGKKAIDSLFADPKTQQGVAEARGKDQDQFGGMHQDDFQEKLMRLKQLAQAGPMKTVYDPNKRVYKNMPTAVQPPRPPKK